MKIDFKFDSSLCLDIKLLDSIKSDLEKLAFFASKDEANNIAAEIGKKFEYRLIEVISNGLLWSYRVHDHYFDYLDTSDPRSFVVTKLYSRNYSVRDVEALTSETSDKMTKVHDCIYEP